jgi:hypothetical protein
MRHINLGHGVRVARRRGEGLQVSSRELALPWSVRAGPHVGSAVLWEGEAYEVVSRTTDEHGDHWSLEPWPSSEAMRTVFRVDGAWVDSMAHDREDARRTRVWRLLALPISPILALAPAPIQTQWSRQWGFPAHEATAVSAVFELAAGFVGVVQAFSAGIGGNWFLPPGLRFMVVIGPLIAIEGLVRLSVSVAQSEPMGSVIGLPLALLRGRSRPPARRSAAAERPQLAMVALVTALACIAPRRYQERWGRRLNTRPIWFTILGAGAELLGGWVNLEGASAGDGSIQLAANLFFLIESLVRFALVVMTGRPVGSLLGLPLSPLLDRLIPGD